MRKTRSGRAQNSCRYVVNSNGLTYLVDLLIHWMFIDFFGLEASAQCKGDDFELICENH